MVYSTKYAKGRNTLSERTSTIPALWYGCSQMKTAVTEVPQFKGDKSIRTGTPCKSALCKVGDDKPLEYSVWLC